MYIFVTLKAYFFKSKLVLAQKVRLVPDQVQIHRQTRRDHQKVAHQAARLPAPNENQRPKKPMVNQRQTHANQDQGKTNKKAAS